MATNSPNELSFLPDDYLHRKAKRRATIIGCALLSLVVSGVGGALFVTEKSMGQIERRHEQAVHNFTEAARRIEEVKKLHEQQRKIVRHAELAASLVEKVPRSNVLAELTNSLPKGTSLLDMTLESQPHHDPPPAGLTSFDAKKAELEAKHRVEANGPEAPRFDVYIKITGVADTDGQVAEYLKQLNHKPLFQDVNLVISDAYTAPGEKGVVMRRFQMQMMINPSAEVKDIPKPPAAAVVEINQ